MKANSYDTLAYFAHIKRPRDMKKGQLRMVKLRYMHQAFQVILQPLVAMALFGQVSDKLTASLTLNVRLGHNSCVTLRLCMHPKVDGLLIPMLIGEAGYHCSMLDQAGA